MSQRYSLALVVAIVAVTSSLSCRVIPENVGWERDDAPSSLITGPYIIRQSEDTAFILMRVGKATSEPVVDWWRYTGETGETGEEESPTPVGSITATIKEDVYIAKLEDLPKGIEIGYRVRIGKQTSPSYKFRTSAAPGESFRFAVFGDTRTRHGVHASVVDQVVKEDVDFVIHTGDMVHRGGVRELWDLFFQIERPLLANAPVFPSIGNHDVGRRQYYERYFLLGELGNGRRYYFSDWNNIRLVAVDGSIEGREGSQQYAFAARALKQASDRGMFTIMYLHWPPYSSGYHGSQLAVREPITALARRYGVELVVTGHDHIYERTIPIDGTTYLVSGSAGAPTRNVKPSWFTASTRTEPHYVLIDVEAERLIMRAVNLDGTVFDSAVIRDNPPENRAASR